ncbi:MAG: hypothetical protein JW781_05385 [Deltaproteobacteria bacterium]|nr:hypothetical protein [Candidatus Anaeroferrophillacea bacterium]
MSRTSILARYERTPDNRLIIDAAVRGIEDLYEHFDRTAPYLKKDLEENFAAYLLECAREIGRQRFIIRICLSAPVTKIGRERVRRSINSYFIYLGHREQRAIGRLIRRTLLLMALGTGLLLLAILAGRRLPVSASVTAEVFAQGLTVAAWVSLWEGIATLLLDWQPLQRERNICRRLAVAPVEFRRLRPDPPEAGAPP